jgi:hypothetical protein
MKDWPFFNCSKCKALYHVVKVAPGREIVEGKVTCRLCGEPLPSREGLSLVKYFLVPTKGVSRAGQR